VNKRETNVRYLIVLMLLAGCASEPKQTYWEKPGASAQDFNQDIGQCRAQAFGNTMNLMQAAIIQSSCMAGKGWYTVER
jgi:uncharacterized lipoprotein YmbA